jgi:HAMP domain-containing protein
MTTKKFSVSLNPKHPQDAALMQRLAHSRNASSLIKQALAAQDAPLREQSFSTEQELGALKTEIAWLRQSAGGSITPRMAEIAGELNGLLDQLEAALGPLLSEETNIS